MFHLVDTKHEPFLFTCQLIELKRNPDMDERRSRPTLKPLKKSRKESDEMELHQRIKVLTEFNTRQRQRLKEVINRRTSLSPCFIHHLLSQQKAVRNKSLFSMKEIKKWKIIIMKHFSPFIHFHFNINKLSLQALCLHLSCWVIISFLPPVKSSNINVGEKRK